MNPAIAAHRPGGLHATGRLLRVTVFALAMLASTGSMQAFGSESTPAQTSRFEQVVDEAFERYAPPGLAVGVVVDGEVVYTATRGELVAGEGTPVDSQTLFKIASNSKAMTGALLARLVDQGKLAWTDPVVKHLPDFRMHDDWVTREMQVRDLLIHNSGLGAGAGDLMLWPGPNRFTRADVIHGLRYLKPVYSFRSRYAYDNTLYIVAGEVAAAAGRAPYDALLRRELFAPLGMARCQAGQWNRDAVGNIAQPHALGDDGRQTVAGADGATIPDVPMMAAGGIRCSLSDMLEWVRMWLQPEDVGTDAQGRPWLSAGQREEAWKTHMPMPLSKRMREWDNSHFSAYGYGWRLTDVDGTWKVSHTGTLSGMYSAVVLLPQMNSGFVILINGNADELRTVLTQVLVKQFTNPEAAGLSVAHYARLIADERGSKQVAGTTPPPATHARNALAPGDADDIMGRYRDPWFGDVTICRAGEDVEFLAAKSPSLHGKVMREGERLLVDWHDPGVDAEAWLAFAPPQEGRAMLTMAKVDPEADFSYDYEDLAFQRIGDCPGR